MGHKKEDRRIRRTRQLLRDAYVNLLMEKGYEAITVQDIIDQADVARSTFYAHFLDKEDLLLGQHGIFSGNLDQHTKEKFFAEDDQENQSILPMRGLFRHLQTHHHIYKAMLGGPGVDLAIKALYDMLGNNIQHKLEPHLPDDQNLSVPLPLLAEYLAGALISLIKWWLGNDMPYSPERMDDIFQQLAMPGVYLVLQKTV